MTFPSKINYASGDILTAAQMNDIGSEINALNGTAGKNKIINGDFRINQRSFSSTTATGEFTFDRFRTGTVGGTSTFSAQTFTLGAAPVAGYEGTNFIRVASTGQSAAGDLTQLVQRIESVRTLAGQTVTVSFWAKASSGTPSIAADLLQYFGTGGSPSTAVSVAGQKSTITTSWARYTFTYTLPSISGKTIGTNNNDSLWLRLWTSAGSTYNTETNTIGIQSATIDIWGVQVEAGSLATAFQTATGTLQGELAACQRYYQRISQADANRYIAGVYFATGTTNIQGNYPITTQMRGKPSSVDFANLSVTPDNINSALSVTSVTISGNADGGNSITLGMAVTGATQYRPYMLYGSSANSYLGVSAEL
jgi:hypothetical protein